MNALISQIMTLAKPSRPEMYRGYLERMPARELEQKLRDLEESQTRSGNGYRTGRDRTLMTEKTWATT